MLWNAGLPKSVPMHDIAIQVRDNEIVLGYAWQECLCSEAG